MICLMSVRVCLRIIKLWSYMCAGEATYEQYIMCHARLVYMRIHDYVYAYKYVRMYVVCMYVCMFVCIYEHICTPYT